jgi:alkyl hydroperoxide reductase subunit AhpF
MGLLDEEDVKYLQGEFADLAREVTLTVVAREPSRLVLPGEEPRGHDTTQEIKQLIAEVAATSPRLKHDAVDAGADPDRAHALAGERLPAIVFSAPGARGRIRYYGSPAGYEMSTVVATISDLGSAEAVLPEDVAARLAAITRDIHIQVFVTPS